MIKLYYYCCTIWSAVTIITEDKKQLPVRGRLDMDVINDIDVTALNSEFMQQRLHPARHVITLINFHVNVDNYFQLMLNNISCELMLLPHEFSLICPI